MSDKDSGDKQPWLVPVAVAVVGAISTVAVAWLNKPQQPTPPSPSVPSASSTPLTTPSPSPSQASSILSSPNSTLSSPNSASAVSSLVRLRTFWNDRRKDNYPLALPESEKILTIIEPIYREVRTEGCIFADKVKGTIPLKNYWNAQYEDNYPLASSEGESEAIHNGYVFTGRIEGYIYAEKVENSKLLRI